jgi:benzodiazapine receptor
MKINYWKLIISIVICELAGAIGSIFTVNAIPSWYANLVRPSFSPPNWIFGPVWTTLYLLMGIALYIVWNKGFKIKNSKKAVGVFGVQLGLNTIWSIIFFGLNNIKLAFAEIIFLWIAILLSIIYFYRIDKKAAYLLVPYLLWVSFAAVLNFYFMILN